MHIHGKKFAAVCSMKWRTLFSKNFIAMPLFSIVLSVVMNLVYGSIAASRGGEMTDALRATAVGLGAVMNTTMTGILCTGMALAEEKEKHTLRALMTSSVSGTEFFLGSVTPVAVMTVAVNSIIVAVSGIRLTPAGWAIWIGVSALCAVASVVTGMIFGIWAKDQVTGSTIMSLPMLILVMIPVFGDINETMGRISSFLFTGALQETAQSLAEGTPQVSVTGLLIIAAEVAAAMAVFVFMYRRNGYDAD